MLLGVRDVICWLSDIYIFDEFLNFDLSNINVMREVCLHNNWSFASLFWKYTGHKWDELLGVFLGGWWRWVPTMGGWVGVGVGCGGTHLELGVGVGLRALSQILSEDSLSYSLEHITFLRRITDFRFHGGTHSPTSEHCRPRVRNILLLGRKLECIARLMYFYIFFGMLNTFL